MSEHSLYIMLASTWVTMARRSATNLDSSFEIVTPVMRSAQNDILSLTPQVNVELDSFVACVEVSEKDSSRFVGCNRSGLGRREGDENVSLNSGG